MNKRTYQKYKRQGKNTVKNTEKKSLIVFIVKHNIQETIKADIRKANIVKINNE